MEEFEIRDHHTFQVIREGSRFTVTTGWYEDVGWCKDARQTFDTIEEVRAELADGHFDADDVARFEDWVSKLPAPEHTPEEFGSWLQDEVTSFTARWEEGRAESPEAWPARLTVAEWLDQLQHHLAGSDTTLKKREAPPASP